jgi:transcriptional regulator with XRE-family HTH domain
MMEIQVLRKAARLTQIELAKASGVSRSRIAERDRSSSAHRDRKSLNSGRDRTTATQMCKR